jgi:hypothetical protein
VVYYFRQSRISCTDVMEEKISRAPLVLTDCGFNFLQNFIDRRPTGKTKRYLGITLF